MGITFPLVVAGDLGAAMPEIKSITRFKDYRENLVKVGNQVYREKNLFYADDNFLQNFFFQAEKGDPATTLKSIRHVILSESVAKKYFGDEDPIGKTVSKIGDSVQLFTVAGVVEDAPANSSLQFDWIVPLLSDPEYA